MKPPVEAPTSTQSRPAGSTPSPSSPCASFSPPRETYGGGRSTVELGVLLDLLAGLVVAVDEAGEHERLRLRPRLREATFDEEDVEALLQAVRTASPSTMSRRTDVSASTSASRPRARSAASSAKRRAPSAPCSRT